MNAIFLDRDGVINRSLVRNGIPYAPIDLKDFEILPGVLDGLVLLKKSGYKLIVVTNQPDIKTGKQNIATLNKMHQIILNELPIDRIMICMHTDADRCNCRKPLPGLIHEAATLLQINLKKSWMVGDRWRDILAGQSAGCKCFFINHSYNERQPDGFYIEGKSLFEFACFVTLKNQ